MISRIICFFKGHFKVIVSDERYPQGCKVQCLRCGEEHDLIRDIGEVEE
jgi:hypothetical protein